jgi:hypothetical protein
MPTSDQEQQLLDNNDDDDDDEKGDRSAMLLQGRRPALPRGKSDTVSNLYVRATLARLCPHAN